ncbi:unnamed protein product [Rotaria socialis]|uniref:NHL repeat containing protein n=1 Tax=Rotaria socialis TaxID=392032 RepID=A0A817ZAH4_9BILA|nr:unnamed protein product [Rotaria socialis]
MSNKLVSDWEQTPSPYNTINKSSKSSRSAPRQRSSGSANNEWHNDQDHGEEKTTKNRQKKSGSSHWYSCWFRGFLLGSLLAGLALAIVISLWLTMKTTATTSSSTTGINRTKILLIALLRLSLQRQLLRPLPLQLPRQLLQQRLQRPLPLQPHRQLRQQLLPQLHQQLPQQLPQPGLLLLPHRQLRQLLLQPHRQHPRQVLQQLPPEPRRQLLQRLPLPFRCVRPNWLWDANGQNVAGVTGVSGSTADKLNAPWNIYVDTTNNLYIADAQNHRIQKWAQGATTGTTIAGSSGTSGSSSTLLNIPKDVFVDSSENIYVADSGNHRIQFFASGNTTGLTVSTNWTSAGSMWGVQVVNNSIYACDRDSNIVWNNGTAVASNQWSNNAGFPLKLPQGFAVDASIAVGTVYITNSDRHTVVKWPVGAVSGTTVAGVDGNSGNTSTLLKFPSSLKLDNYTNMFVVDNNNHRIQLFCQYPTVNTTGRTIAGTGSMGQTNTTLNYPAGVALDASRNLYVADTSNHRVQKFQYLL